LSASIPLLRGAGMVNLEALIQSEREIIYEVRAFETYRRQFVVDIASRYYRLLTELQSINNRRMNYASRIALTERTQALYAAGRLRFDEVQRSLQAQLQAENDLANVTDQYQGSLDDFKLLIGMPVEEDMEIIPIELKLQVPSTDSHQVVELAQKYRLDLQTSKDRIDDARRKVNVAKNGLLPDLDFEANTAVGNFKDTPAGHLNARTQTYDAGFTLDLPIDRVSERNAYRKSLIELERADRGFLTSRDQIIADVRDAIRGIRQAQTTLEIQRRGIELAQRRLEYNNELLLQGKTDARSVADAQDDLLRAQDSFDQATSNLQVAILQYLRDTGTLRVDPNAGALGQAMDRAALQGKRLDRAALDANDLLPAR
jgi:outer membrane protein TolC